MFMTKAVRTVRREIGKSIQQSSNKIKIKNKNTNAINLHLVQIKQIRNRRFLIKNNRHHIKFGILFRNVNKFRYRTRNRNILINNSIKRLFCSPSKTIKPSNKHFVGVAFSGLSGGLIGALAGTGGGLVMIPLLKAFTKMTPHQIAGASLAAILGGSLIATLSYSQKKGMICAPIAITMAICSSFSAIIGVKLAPKVSSKLLTSMTSLFLFSSIYPIYNKQRLTEQNNKQREIHLTNKQISPKISCKEQMKILLSNPIKWYSTDNNYQYPIIGCISGVLTGLLGLGGGIVMTTYLAGYTNLTQHQVIGTSLFCVIPQALIALTIHASHGTVALPIALVLASSNAIGMFISSQYALDIPEKYLRDGLCVILFGSATGMARTAYTLFRSPKPLRK